MGANTRIEWTNATWNPITGCAKVSQGCKHCYAERDWARLQHLPSYRGRAFTDVACHPERLDQPLRWTRPRLIFVNSMSDLFHPDVPDSFIDQVFAVMALAPKHTFQVLTKRAERMRSYLSDPHAEERIGQAEAEFAKLSDFYKLKAGASNVHVGCRRHLPLPNVWIGVTVEDQAAADERIPLLLDTPAAVRWISAEPLLGPVDLRHINDGKEFNEIDCLTPWTWEQEVDAWRGLSATWESDFSDWYNGTKVDAIGPMHNKLDWVVVGGESGPKARPMHPEWARSLRDQCAAAGVPFLFKQWGEWVPRSDCYHTFEDGKSCADYDPGATQWPCIRLTESGHDGRRLENEDGGDSAYMQRVGKKAAGRLLDGVVHDEFPLNNFSVYP